MPSKFTVNLAQIDWAQLNWKIGLWRVPAIVIALLAGMLSGHPAAGVVAAGTALPVGFAGSRQLHGSRLLTMWWTTGIMAFSAMAGSLAGNAQEAIVAATVVWTFACGLLTVANEDLGWVAMQSVIALVVASAFPSEGLFAMLRAVFILLGGILQIAFIVAFWRMAGISRFGREFGDTQAPQSGSTSLLDSWAQFRKSPVFSRVAFQYAVTVAITMVVAIELDHWLQLQNGYWLPMTTIIILKPDFYRTYTGGVQRVAGTLAAVLVASVIALVLRPNGFVLVALAGIFALLTYAFQKVNAVFFSGAITAFVVFMIALTGLPEAGVMAHRLVNTLLGCLLALLSRFVGHILLARLFPEEAAKQAA